MKPKYKILLLNGLSNNLGDQAISLGQRNAISAAANRRNINVQITNSFIYSYQIRDSNIDQINNEYDMIILGGGGIIYKRNEEESPSGWGFNIPEDLISKLNIPLVIYGAGYNYRAYTKRDFPPCTAGHLRKTAEKAALFSMRDHNSIRILKEKMNISSDIRFMPDAAMCVEPYPGNILSALDGKPSVGVCLRLDHFPERFPEPAEEHFLTFVNTLKKALIYLVEKAGFTIVWIPHIASPLEEMIANSVAAAMPDRNEMLYMPTILPDLYNGNTTINPSILAGIYKDLDLVIGQRFHSLLLSLSMGTPLVSISSTLSNKWLLKEFGLENQHIDITDFDNNITTQNIINRSYNAMKCGSRNKIRLKNKRREFLEIIDDTNDQIMNILCRRKTAHAD